MSYSYELSSRAQSQFQNLDAWIAEEILDEMEVLISKAPSEGRQYAGGFIHDFVRLHGTDTIYVFLTIAPDPRRELLEVANIGLHVRLASDPA